MEPVLILLGLAAIGLLLVGLVWTLRRAKARYRELLDAVHSVQRDLADLQQRLDRDVVLRETAARVRRAAAAGALSEATARRLIDDLAQLSEENAIPDRPY